jgi:methylenetetrahydrofolate reductase (NADPH)
LGAADNPVDPAPGWQPKGLAAKVAAGAQFVQTQFCMDAGVVRRYMARLTEYGVAGNVSMIVGIVPLRSAKSARWIKDKLYGAIIPDAVIERMERATDPAAEGRRICLDMMTELADIPHVAGCHVMAPGNETAVPEVIAVARDSVKRLAAV